MTEIMAIPGHLARTRELLDFLDQLAPGDFAEIAGRLREKGEFADVDLSAMIGSSWARLDPQAAANWAWAGTDNLRGAVLQAWGAANPQEAVAWVTGKLPEFFDDSPSAGNPTPLAEVLGGAALSDPSILEPVLSRMKSGQASILYEIALRLEGHRPGGVDPLLAAMDSGPVRTQLIVQSARYMTLGDRGLRAVELLQQDEKARERLPLKNFFDRWGKESPSGLRLALDQMPDDPAWNLALASACRSASTNDVVDAFDLLRRYPAASDDHLVAEIADQSPLEHAALAMGQVLQMSDPTLRDEVLVRRLGWWRSQSPAEAGKWMESHTLSPAVRAAVLSSPSAAP